MAACKLGSRKYPATITMKEMKDGQLAVVTDAGFSAYKGRVVQRFGNKIIMLGLPDGNNWGTDCPLEVRVLEPGETIVVQ